MNKVEALEWAADYVVRNKLFDAPVNQRGYPVDGWQNPTPAERAKIISDLADQAMQQVEPELIGNPMAPLAVFLEQQVQELRAIRAKVDGLEGNNIQNVSNWLERMAKELLSGGNNDDG